MGVSQILIMYITSLNIMAFNILIMKHQNMLKMNNMKECKMRIRDRYQNHEGKSLGSRPRWSSHQTSLVSDAYKIFTV